MLQIDQKQNLETHPPFQSAAVNQTNQSTNQKKPKNKTKQYTSLQRYSTSQLLRQFLMAVILSLALQSKTTKAIFKARYHQIKRNCLFSV